MESVSEIETKATPPDDFGRVVYVERAKKPDTDLIVVGGPGWRGGRWKGFEEKLSTERAAQAMRAAVRGELGPQMYLMREMPARDGSLAALLSTRVTAPTGLARTMLPATIRGGTQADIDLAQEVAEECAEMVDSINEFDTWLIDYFDAIPMGLSVSEIIYRADGSIEAFRWVDPVNLEFDDDGYLVIVDHLPSGIEQRIRVADYPWKFIIHRAKTRSGSVSDTPLLKSLLWPFIFRNYALKDWSVYLETFGMPIRIGKYGAGASDKDKAQLSMMLEKMASDAWAVISEKTSIEFEEIASRGVEPYSAFYKAMRGEYALACVGQEGTNLPNEYGAKADAVVKGTVRQDLLENDCSQGEASFKRDALFAFVMFRRGLDIARRYTPTLHFQYEPAIDYAAQAVVDRTVLIELGVGRRVPIAAVGERYGWSEFMVDADDPNFNPDEMVVGAAPEIPDDEDGSDDEDADADKGVEKRLANGGKASGAALAALDRAFRRSMQRYSAGTSPEQETLDDLGDRVTEKADKVFRGLSDDIKAMIATSEDLKDLRRRLQEQLRDAYDSMDRTKLEELTERAVFAARLYGRGAMVDAIRKKAAYKISKKGHGKAIRARAIPLRKSGATR